MKIFISYSHKDKKYLDDLMVHLKPITRGNGAIELWSDIELKQGDDWRKKIQFSIENCNVAILLISANFLASDFIVNNELQPLYNRYNNDGVHILCVPLSHSSFESDAVLLKFQTLPSPDRPIKELSAAKRDKTYELIRKRLAEIGGLNLALSSTTIESNSASNTANAKRQIDIDGILTSIVNKMSIESEKKEFIDEYINISQLWKSMYEHTDEHGFLSKYKFKNCYISGPSVIYLVNCSFLSPNFADETVGIESHLYTQFKKNEDQYIYGVLLFQDCEFLNCTFDDIAFFVFDGKEAQSYLKILRTKKNRS